MTTPAPNRLLLVVNCLDIGGAEIQVMRLALGMIRRGWHVGVVSLLKPGPLEPTLRQAGAEIFTLNMHQGVPNPIAILRLRRIVKAFCPTIVHSHILHSNLIARVTRLVAPIPVLLCTAHNLREGGRFFELSYRYTDRLADLTTNVSQAAVDRYVQVKAAPANRIRFMPNGLNLSEFLTDSGERARLRQELQIDDQFVWLAVGRFRKQKDYPNLLRAFAQLVGDPSTRKSTVIIAGSGPCEDESRQLAQSLKLGDRVRFLGLRNDVSALMKAADAFVLSSEYEGMPLVLQEAAACALPTVATDVGGNREVALDGTSAILAPAKNATALADAMRRMMSLSPEQRRSMGAAGREHVIRHYEMENVLDRWEAIYRELTNPATTRPVTGCTPSAVASEV